MEKILNRNDYIVRKIEDKYVFLKFTNGDSHLLDEIGTLFLDTYLDYGDCKSALIALCDIYPNIQKEIIQRDFEEFIELLKEKEILIAK